MIYNRTFRIQAAHFNSARAYEIAWHLLDGHYNHGGNSAQIDLIKMVKDVHGHNFKIEVGISGPVGEDGWVIDDARLANFVMEWDNQNLSMHPDFSGRHLRATTEMMARTLLMKLRGNFGKALRDGHEEELISYVTVHENEDICASSGGGA